jgi:transcription initiation factor TFIID subunit TAF12
VYKASGLGDGKCVLGLFKLFLYVLAYIATFLVTKELLRQHSNVPKKEKEQEDDVIAVFGYFHIISATIFLIYRIWLACCKRDLQEINVFCKKREASYHLDVAESHAIMREYLHLLDRQQQQQQKGVSEQQPQQQQDQVSTSRMNKDDIVPDLEAPDIESLQRFPVLDT